MAVKHYTLKLFGLASLSTLQRLVITQGATKDCVFFLHSVWVSNGGTVRYEKGGSQFFFFFFWLSTNLNPCVVKLDFDTFGNEMLWGSIQRISERGEASVCQEWILSSMFRFLQRWQAVFDLAGSMGLRGRSAATHQPAGSLGALAERGSASDARLGSPACFAQIHWAKAVWKICWPPSSHRADLDKRHASLKQMEQT